MHDSSKQSSDFGKYRLIAELGQGGMADVFLAVQQGPVGFSKLVVVKRLRETFVDDPEFVAMLLDEARLAARLNHPNIVQTNEVGEFGRHHFIAMEYLEGQPLHRVMHRAKKQSPMPESYSLRVLSDVLAGLHHAHELADFDGTPLGVVHRDVTPHNIFITYDGVVKVVDFGIAKAVGRTAETRTGVLKGKVTYMAPEQAAGDDLDRRADIFSVGVLLWEALVGNRMWAALPDVVIVSKLVNGELPPLPIKVKPDVDPELNRICAKALAHKPADRYATAADFRADLEAHLKKASHVTVSDLGDLVSKLFADRRKELKAVVEKQLALIKSNAPLSVLGDPMPGSTSMPGLSIRTPTGTSSPSLSSMKTINQTLAVESPRSVRALTLGVPGVEEVAVASGNVPVRAGGRSRARLLGGAALLAAALVGGYVGLIRNGSSSSAANSQNAEMLSIRLRARPASARFRVDGGEPLENPYLAQFRKDGSKHVLRVEAEGFKSVERELEYNGDISLELTLDPLVPGDVPSTTPSAVTTSPSTTSSPAATVEPSVTSSATSAPRSGPRTPRGGSKTATPANPPPPPAVTGRPKRQLDPENPW